MKSVKLALTTAVIVVFSRLAPGADADPNLKRFQSFVPRTDLKKFLSGTSANAQAVAELNSHSAQQNRCAHIILHEPPADLDTGILSRNVPGPERGAMLPKDLMPVCPNDIRPMKKQRD